MQEALLDLYTGGGFPCNLTVADLGCSSGPNALSVVADVIRTVEERCRLLGRSPPQFQLFLNDLPGNDFNSVFLSLQAFHEKRNEPRGCGGAGEGRPELGRCFVAGVPGSFYRRLFLDRSVDFFHSSSSLHWLSQVPLQLQQPGGPVNRGNIYISGESPPAVVDAYSLQFRDDFSSFLRFRSEEMAAGGHMVLILVGRKTADPTSEEATFQWSLLTQVLAGMVREGQIAQEKVDSFNAPYYSPCAREVEDEIRREGSFSLKRLQVFQVAWDAEKVLANHVVDQCHGDDPVDAAAAAAAVEQPEKKKKKKTTMMSRGQSMANCVRAVLESMLTTHFGGDAIEDIFLRYSHILEDYLERKRPKLTNIVVSLVRKK